MSSCDRKPENFDLFGALKDLQYQLIRNKIEEDDFLCIVARLPGSNPILARSRRDQVHGVLINSLPSVGRKHPMTMEAMKRIDFFKKLFGKEAS